MLQRTKTGVLLTIPWDGGATAVYQRWFGRDAHWGDDEDKSKYTYEIPPALVFHDVFGSVHLVGCRLGGSQGDFFSQIGQGSIRADVTVFGGADQVDFSSVHGVRTEVSGLRAWIGAQSVHRDRPEVGPNGIRSVTFTVQSPDSIAIPRYPTLSLEPSWTVEPSEGATTLREQLYVLTRFEEPTQWSDHFYIHTAVRDLLSMSSWTPQVFSSLECIHDESPERTLGGAARGDQWLDAITTLVEVAPSSPKRGRVNHFIEYDDLGPEGLAAWLDLRREFDRAIAPIEASVYLADLTVEVRLMQLGAGLEALAYLLLCRDGVPVKQAARTALVARLTLIAERIAAAIPFDGVEWATSTAAAYNGVKHANRSLPDPVELANRWRESVLVFRLWLALELGVKAEDLKSRVESDPQIHPFVAG